ncbi:hypothetical protein EDB19DRAFT_1360934 [Suillus lakei]|nr:hypothetical protein EDB19DRAFT_1360934 [Suillus lakei]
MMNSSTSFCVLQLQLLLLPPPCFAGVFGKLQCFRPNHCWTSNTSSLWLCLRCDADHECCQDGLIQDPWSALCFRRRNSLCMQHAHVPLCEWTLDVEGPKEVPR